MSDIGKAPPRGGAQSVDTPPAVRLLNVAATHPDVIAFANRKGYGVRAGAAATDYAVAKFIGVSSQAVSNWRSGDRGIGASRVLLICARLKLTDARTFEFICDFERTRARSTEQRGHWDKLKARLTPKLGAVILPFLLGFPTDVEALNRAYDTAPPARAFNIMLTRIRRWLRGVRSLTGLTRCVTAFTTPNSWPTLRRSLIV